MRKALSGRLYYGWVVVGGVFLALLVSAGVRAAPAVLINPLEDELGWGRAAISFAVSVGLLIYGLSGPAAGWLMDRLGPKKVTLAGLCPKDSASLPCLVRHYTFRSLLRRAARAREPGTDLRGRSLPRTFEEEPLYLFVESLGSFVVG